jgi:predicted outer membrane repeat protein
MRHLTLGILVCLISATFVVGSSLADVWYVLPDGTGDAPTIQAAIDSAANGDQVRLGDGLFSGPGNRDMSFQGKAISVVSENGAQYTIIECDGDAAEPHRGFLFDSGESASSVLDGLTIRGAYEFNGAGIRCNGSSPTIRNCIFTDNKVESSGGAIYVGMGASPGIIRCVFYNNTAWGGAGLFGYYGSFPTLSGCTFAYNSATYGAGFMSREWVTAYNTIVAFAPEGDAVRGCATLSCCNLYGNAGGDWDDWCITGQQNLNGNFSADPIFCDPASSNFQLAADSPCLPGGVCGLVGARGQGCGLSTSVSGTETAPSSWGLVKTLFR